MAVISCTVELRKVLAGTTRWGGVERGNGELERDVYVRSLEWRTSWYAVLNKWWILSGSLCMTWMDQHF